MKKHNLKTIKGILTKKKVYVFDAGIIKKNKRGYTLKTNNFIATDRKLTTLLSLITNNKEVML